MSRARTATANGPVNVVGAKRTHPRLRLVKTPTPPGNYTIVHGSILLENPELSAHKAAGKSLADWDGPVAVEYYPGEVIRLGGDDADHMLATGVIVPVGETPVLITTMPDRDRSYFDRYTTDKDGNPKKKTEAERDVEGPAERVERLDVEAAIQRLYNIDSTRRSGGLNGSGR